MTNPLVFISACQCAGSGCGGHTPVSQIVLDERDITPIGYQGAAQHTYTLGCDGFHEPGQCPRTEVKP